VKKGKNESVVKKKVFLKNGKKKPDDKTGTEKGRKQGKGHERQRKRKKSSMREPSKEDELPN